jgi:hypothetical protein
MRLCSFCSWQPAGKNEEGKTNRWVCTMCNGEMSLETTEKAQPLPSWPPARSGDVASDWI